MKIPQKKLHCFADVSIPQKEKSVASLQLDKLAKVEQVYPVGQMGGKIVLLHWAAGKWCSVYTHLAATVQPK